MTGDIRNVTPLMPCVSADIRNMCRVMQSQCGYMRTESGDMLSMSALMLSMSALMLSMSRVGSRVGPVMRAPTWAIASKPHCEACFPASALPTVRPWCSELLKVSLFLLLRLAVDSGCFW